MENRFKLMMLIIISVLLTTNIVFSTEHFNEEDIAKKLPQIASANNSGRDFWFSIPPCYEEASSGANFIRVFCVSPSKNKIICEVPGLGLFISKAVKANELTVFDLKPSEGQPFLHALGKATPPARIYPAKGVHVFSDNPIVCYVIVRYLYTSDGMLCIPTNSLGKEYIAGPYTSSYWDGLVAWTLITSPYDNTKVTFTMGGDGASTVETETKVLDQPGKFVNITMQKGDVYCVGAMKSKMDIAGSKIVANKPVAVTTGIHCANIPLTVVACDYNCEMETPTETWGKSILIPVCHNRMKPGLIRIFAKYPNTKVYRDGAYFTTIKHGGGPKDDGWIEDRASPLSDPRSPFPVIYTADKPFSIMYYNPGTSDDPIQTNTDPFQMLMIPVEQFQSEIMFGCVNAAGGLKIGNSFMNIVYELDSNGNIPKDLEFGTWNGSAWVYQIIDTMQGKSNLFNQNVPINEKLYGVKNIIIPGNGVFKIRSLKGFKFTCYSYGFDSYDSYGFPTSSALAVLESYDTNCPLPIFTQDCNGSVGVLTPATVTDKPDDEAVRSNLSEVYMITDPDSSYNYLFSVGEITSGETITMNWKLVPIDQFGDARAVLVFKDKAGNDTTITIEYFPSLVNVDSLVSFGNFRKNTPAITKDIIIKNKSKKEIFVNKISFKKGNLGFTLEPITWNKNLPIASGDFRTVSVKFNVDTNLIVNYLNTLVDTLNVVDDCNISHNCVIKSNLYKIEKDLIPPSVTYTQECNGKIGVNSNAYVVDMAFDTLLRSNLKEILIDTTQSKSFNYKLNVGNITKGVTTSTTFSLIPIDTLKDAKATVIFRDFAGNDTVIVFSNKVTKLLISKDLDFGNFKSTDNKFSKIIFVKNESNKEVTIKELKLQKANNGFTLEPITWDINKAIAIGDSRSVFITFNPIEASKNTSQKLFVDSLGIGDDCWFNNKIKVVASIDSTSGIENSESDLFSIDAIIPNPITNEGGIIQYSIGKEAKVEINIINSIGNKIELLLNQNTQIGKYRLDIPINKLQNGTYFVELKAENHILNKKFIIIK